MNIYLRKVASEGINHHVEHCIFVPASRVLFSSRCPTFRVSLLSSWSQSEFVSSNETWGRKPPIKLRTLSRENIRMLFQILSQRG